MERITIMKTVTFSVENLRASVATEQEKQVSTISDEEIVDKAWEWAKEWFGSEDNLIMIDEEGNEL